MAVHRESGALEFLDDDLLGGIGAVEIADRRCLDIVEDGAGLLRGIERKRVLRVLDESYGLVGAYGSRFVVVFASDY